MNNINWEQRSKDTESLLEGLLKHIEANKFQVNDKTIAKVWQLHAINCHTDKVERVS